MEAVQLVGRQQLVVERSNGVDNLHIIGSDGRLSLTISITSAGPVLEINGGGIMIRATGALGIDAETVSIAARNGLTLQSGGDARVSAAGSLELMAESQQITAHARDVRVYANDDVVLDGERVRMNC